MPDDLFDSAIEDLEQDKKSRLDLLDEPGQQESGEEPVQAGGGDIDDNLPPEREEAATPERRQEHAQPSSEPGQPPVEFDYNERRRQIIADAEERRRQWEEAYDERERALDEARKNFLSIKRKAREEGEDLSEEAELEAQEAIAAARYDFEEAERTLEQANKYYEQEASRPELAAAPTAWYSANADRYGVDKAFTEKADAEMRKLVNEGYDVNKLPFYTKLDERMKATPRMGRAGRGRSPAAPPSRTERTREQPGELDSRQKKFMREMGQNPDNPVHVQVAKETIKRAHEAFEDWQGRGRR